MQYAQALPTVLTVLALAYMGFLVIRTSKELINRLFLTFLVIDSTWLVVVSIITNTTAGTNDYLGRFAYTLAILLVMSILAFSNALLQLNRGRVFRILVYDGGFVVAALTQFSDQIIKDVEVKNGLPFPVYGSLYFVYSVYLLGIIITYLYALFKRWRSLRDSEDVIAKRQLSIVVFGIATFTLISLSTNLLLPAIFSDAWPSLFAPLGSLALSLSFFYAINRYKLFDIKTAAVRSTTYIFLTLVLAGIYVASINISTSLVTIVSGGQSLERFFDVLIVLGIAISFQPLKHLFDRITNKVFFKDIYDTQNVVNGLNKILISSTELKQMVGECRLYLSDKIKLEYCAVLLEPKKNPSFILDFGKSNFSPQDYAQLHGVLVGNREKILENTGIHGGYKSIATLFKEKNIGAICRMKTHTEDIGLLVFGTKKNGDRISRQDTGVLGIAADQIAIASQNMMRHEEIKQFTKTLQGKVEDATRELRRKNERLRVLDQTKDDFISMASHQLRTPLTSVKGYVSMVLDGDAGKVTELQKKLLTQSFLSSQRMVYLISDLLNVSRLRTGKFVIEPIESNLADVIESEVEQLQETAKGRELTLVYKKPEHFPTLMIDENKLRQVIMNFIDNAIYYTPSKGTITINLVDRPDAIEFTVVDDGIGVPKAEQHHLFSKFYRAHNAKRARPDGTGLGLFMAKKVIIAQGGAIIFKSQEGKGSTFGFTFPKKKLLTKDKMDAESLKKA